MADRFSRIGITISAEIRDKLNKEESHIQNGVRLFIPTISDKIILTKNWNFKLMDEYRNRYLVDRWRKFYDVEEEMHNEGRDRYGLDRINKYLYVSLPAGTILAIDRFYIRGKGPASRNFDSITFRILKGSTCKNLIGSRFWASLRFINQIECDLYKPEEI